MQLTRHLFAIAKFLLYNTSVLRTDGQADRIAISISRVSVLTRDKNTCFLHSAGPLRGACGICYTYHYVNPTLEELKRAPRPCSRNMEAYTSKGRGGERRGKGEKGEPSHFFVQVYAPGCFESGVVWENRL